MPHPSTALDLPPASESGPFDLRALGLRRFRVDLLRETPEPVGLLLDAYRGVIAGADDGRDAWKRLRAMNQLGVTRGTLQLL